MSAKPVRTLNTLRIPVEQIPVTMVLFDGQPFDAVVFVPFGETILRFFEAGPRFVPVRRDGKICFIARADLACLTVPISTIHPSDGDLPVVFQPVGVKLRSGLELEGKLRWVAPIGYQRTADHLNAEAPYLELRNDAVTHYVAKAHIVTVDER
jgi:hypothetical protein